MQNTKVTFKQLEELVPQLFKANVVPFIHGSPGCGKSATVKAIADKFKLKFIDVRLSQLDPSDLLGLPTFNEDKVKFKPVDLFPLETDKVPEGYNGFLLFLDEANGASHAVQMASYRLILDREIGNYKLHPKVAIVAAGNLETDNAIVNTMSSALISRFAHFEVKLKNEEWLEWAASADLDYRITSFIGFKPDLLYTFNPDATSPYSCPRTWHMASRVIKDKPLDSKDIPLLASMVGEGVAREFITYTKLYKELPTFNAIVKDPLKVGIPNELGTQWAVMSMVCSKVDETTANPVSTYLERLPMELQVCALRELKNRKGQDFLLNSIQEWFAKTAAEIHRT